MISKMLVPAAKDRILITHLLAFVDHPKALPPVNEFPDPEDIWRQMVSQIMVTLVVIKMVLDILNFIIKTARSIDNGKDLLRNEHSA